MVPPQEYQFKVFKCEWRVICKVEDGIYRSLDGKDLKPRRILGHDAHNINGVVRLSEVERH